LRIGRSRRFRGIRGGMGWVCPWERVSDVVAE
jgi:hypothetical protein